MRVRKVCRVKATEGGKVQANPCETSVFRSRTMRPYAPLRRTQECIFKTLFVDIGIFGTENTVQYSKIADFADLKCEASAKSVTGYATRNQ